MCRSPIPHRARPPGRCGSLNDHRPDRMRTGCHRPRPNHHRPPARTPDRTMTVTQPAHRVTTDHDHIQTGRRSHRQPDRSRIAPQATGGPEDRQTVRWCSRSILEEDRPGMARKTPGNRPGNRAETQQLLTVRKSSEKNDNLAKKSVDRIRYT